jgi:hemerythrin
MKQPASTFNLEPPPLGHPTIDTLHEEMAILLQEAISAPDSKLINTLTRLQLHCEHHFAQEELLMTERRFAGYNEHRHEHQQLLAEFNSMVDAVARGRHQLTRVWLQQRMPEWFRHHVTNLDSLLVSFLKK